jgi:type IV secretory pathway VirB4 component
VYFFDKERSSRITTLGVGGDFYDLAADGGPLAFQPFARIDEEPERNWAIEWLQALLKQESRASHLRDAGEEGGPVERSIVRLGQSAPRIERSRACARSSKTRPSRKPCALLIDGPYGQAAGCRERDLGYGRWQVFEMHELTKSYPNAVMPVLTYLFHRLDQRFGKAPTLLILDEGWLFLDDPVFAPKIREWLKTLRKKKVYVVFASQSLSDLARQPHPGDRQRVLLHQDLSAERHWPWMTSAACRSIAASG